MAGSFIISLDFELHWGGAEKWSLEFKKDYFLTTRRLIPEMLSIFEQYGINATWATVGFLFAASKEKLEMLFPEKKPSYLNSQLNYYHLFKTNQVGADETEDPFHFAASLLKKINETPGQEIASHTFSHYYCNEEGQSINEFDQDLKASQIIAQNTLNLSLLSLVFPRNQYNPEYLKVVKSNDFKVIRVNPNVWFWNSKSKFIFIARAFDTLIPISKKLTFKTEDIKKVDNVILLPASRFFRPFKYNERLFQNLKLRRIKKEMTYAAVNGENYHLWWHPHNFGSHPKENMKQLIEIMEHFKYLQAKYQFQSKSMSDYK